MNISRISIDGLILSIKCLVEKANYIKSRYCNMENSNNDDKWLCQLMWAIGFVLLVMMLSAFFVIKLIEGWDHRGQFGDLFGVVNALFSGLAFAGLIITIRQQHIDLKYQRQAIEQTNQEMQNQTAEFDKQNETLRIQRFENTFFKMLEVQQSIVNDLYAGDSHSQWVDENSADGVYSKKEIPIQDEYRGRNLFYYVFRICDHVINNKITSGSRSVSGLCSVIQFRGKACFDDYMTTTMFDHYFRHLYTILRFITENEWLGVDKQYKYATFVRATLSRYELVMLYYNGFFHPKMKKMMERYCLLNNIRKDLLPMSYEYYVFLREQGVSKEDLRDAHFSIGDFEYYLTDDENDDTRYHLSAFFSKGELDKGHALLNRWRTFIKDKKS